MKLLGEAGLLCQFQMIVVDSHFGVAFQTLICLHWWPYPHFILWYTTCTVETTSMNDFRIESIVSASPSLALQPLKFVLVSPTTDTHPVLTKVLVLPRITLTFHKSNSTSCIHLNLLLLFLLLLPGHNVPPFFKILPITVSVSFFPAFCTSSLFFQIVSFVSILHPGRPGFDFGACSPRGVGKLINKFLIFVNFITTKTSPKNWALLTFTICIRKIRLYSCQHPGAKNFEVLPKSLENLCISATRYLP